MSLYNWKHNNIQISAFILCFVCLCGHMQSSNRLYSAPLPSTIFFLCPTLFFWRVQFTQSPENITSIDLSNQSQKLSQDTPATRLPAPPHSQTETFRNHFFRFLNILTALYRRSLEFLWHSAICQIKSVFSFRSVSYSASFSFYALFEASFIHSSWCVHFGTYLLYAWLDDE